MPSARASALTGPASTFMPRPRGRSGCASTAATDMPAPRITSRAVAANSGVPAKPMRIREAPAGPSRGPLLFLELGPEPRPLERREIVDEDPADQVIHLVLDAHREHALGLQLEGFAARVECANGHFRGPPHAVVVAWHRQAALLAVGLALGRDDLGIDEHVQIVPRRADVDDDDALVDVDLRGSK